MFFIKRSATLTFPYWTAVWRGERFCDYEKHLKNHKLIFINNPVCDIAKINRKTANSQLITYNMIPQKKAIQEREPQVLTVIWKIK